MKATIKYYLIQFEMLMFLVSIVLGTGAAESGMWGWAYFLIFFPFVWGWLSNFSAQMHFCEVYSRAWNIKLKTTK